MLTMTGYEMLLGLHLLGFTVVLLPAVLRYISGPFT
jgi:hypothetical protein